jgi:hypothetical protein
MEALPVERRGACVKSQMDTLLEAVPEESREAFRNRYSKLATPSIVSEKTNFSRSGSIKGKSIRKPTVAKKTVKVRNFILKTFLILKLNLKKLEF